MVTLIPTSIVVLTLPCNFLDDVSRHTGFPEIARDLVEKILVLDPDHRLGSDVNGGGMDAIKAHPFWKGLPSSWDMLHTSTPPLMEAFLPAMEGHEDQDLRGNADVDIDDLLDAAMRNPTIVGPIGDKTELLKKQLAESPWSGFCDKDELIIKEGPVEKRRGLSSKKRQLVLTDRPRLFYIDTSTMVVMGEIPWPKDVSSNELKPQYKTPKSFWVHTPDRIFYLEDLNRQAVTWVDAINQQLQIERAKLK